MRRFQWKSSASLRDCRKRLEKHGYMCTLYGHFGQGIVHTRIDFGLKTDDEIKTFRAFTGEAGDLVMRKAVHFPISGRADGHFVAVAGNWVRSAPSGGGRSDRYDLAVYRLPTEVVEKLSTGRFLRLSDATFEDPGPRAVYTLFGFPGVWTKPITEDVEQWSVKPLEFTTYAYDGSVGAMNDFEPHLHLLLSGSSEDVTAPDGGPLEFRDCFGTTRAPAGRAVGRQRCGVWHIGDLDVPIERWRERDARLAGVLTGMYQGHRAIKATRWIAVTTLLNEAFPELRPVFRLRFGP